MEKIIMSTLTNQIKQTRGPYVIIATVVWEFFSYYGMSSLLILYLTQSLHFSDQYSYSLFGAYTSLTFLTPIIGGWLADNYIGNRISMILGAILIMLGHFSLAFTKIWSLYLGLSFLICGVGLFKANAICLIGEYYTDPIKRSSAFIIYYLGGNIGAAIAPIACGYAAAKYGWDYGFALAGAGMLCGLITLLKFRKYLSNVGNPVKKLTKPLILAYVVTVFSMLAATILIIVKLWNGYVLITTTLIALFMLGKIYLNCDLKLRKKLRLGLVLTCFGVLFWVFCQQGACSVSLFIERFVDRTLFNYLVPTAMFQAVNPGSIVIFGVAIAYCLKKLASIHIILNSVTQVIIGMALLTIGFLIFTLGAGNAELLKISMIWVIIGLTLISVAELFIDPVIISVFNETSPPKSLGTLTAIYFFFAGAIGNYLASWVAKFTATPNEHASAILYKSTYEKIFYVGILLVVGLISIRLKTRQRLR